MRATIIDSFKEFEERIFKKLIELKTAESLNLDGQILMVSCVASDHRAPSWDWEAMVAMDVEYHAITSSCEALAKEIRNLYQKGSKAFQEREKDLEELRREKVFLNDLFPVKVDLFNKTEIFSSREYLGEKGEPRSMLPMVHISINFYELPKLKILY